MHFLFDRIGEMRGFWQRGENNNVLISGILLSRIADNVWLLARASTGRLR